MNPLCACQPVLTINNWPILFHQYSLLLYFEIIPRHVYFFTFTFPQQCPVPNLTKVTIFFSFYLFQKVSALRQWDEIGRILHSFFIF